MFAPMRSARDLSRRFQSLLWLILLGGFLFLSAPRVVRELLSGSIENVGPDHSIDTYLERGIGLPHGRARFATLLRSIPVRQPLTIIARSSDDTCVFVAYLLAYLTWPHRVTLAFVRDHQALPSPPGNSTAFYVGLPAPPSRHTIIVGRLILVSFPNLSAP